LEFYNLFEVLEYITEGGATWHTNGRGGVIKVEGLVENSDMVGGTEDEAVEKTKVWVKEKVS